MTLVVGAHFGDAVGISADTRVTCRHSSGKVEYADDALKVYQMPPFLVGIAGAAIPAIMTLKEFYQRQFKSGPNPEAYQLSADLDWMTSGLVSAHMRIPIEFREPKFRLVMATHATFLEKRPENATLGLARSGLSRSFADSAIQMANPYSNPDLLPLVFCVSFPDGKITTAEAGGVLVAGSGAKHEAFLENHPSLLAATAIGPGDGMASVGRDMITAIETSNDSTVNSFILGATLGPSTIHYTIHSHVQWPSDTEIPSSRWLPMNQNEDKTHVLQADGYSVGLDMTEINKGWIYDAVRGRKLPIRSLLDGTFSTENDMEYIL